MTTTSWRTARSAAPAGAPHERRTPVRALGGYLAMLLVVVVVALPLYWILVSALKERPDIYTVPVTWVPDPVVLENFSAVGSGVAFTDFLRNSVIITVVLTVVQVVLGVLSAFALAFLRFPGRTAVLLFVIAALMVPNQITMISNYALVAGLGWRNTYAGIIVPLAGVAFGTFLLRNHFVSLPREILEAAEMDAAGPLRTLWRVVLPMSWPTVVAFTLITVVNEWNQYLWPLLMADDESVAPLPVGLTQLQDAEGLTNWGPVMAGTVLTMTPILVVFVALQRHMIKGLTTGAVKG
ncbi:carbohydrate ABC transporter permease [Cellulomonas carbonis]|uniref:Glycerol-3-phosphate ABC transporter permease n=1 Tax=Cellulomonas carbonis T26 TaxID=947969 RepID=A0A0A0BTD8_9CELL|nr:carbohydrate ABC transporter permease [Cellulomonas carbonis]KGM10957.1 glycerol-3-phosphate ABC transporter permease [Cellulomonas carbonis T26]GGC02416.1 glycerol-3-phosphate ABC transporter permease [Cellulomonas carbonis]